VNAEGLTAVGQCVELGGLTWLGLRFRLRMRGVKPSTLGSMPVVLDAVQDEIIGWPGKVLALGFLVSAAGQLWQWLG
jgi:hypothetical protein